MQLRVLVGCECSGRVRDAFAALGWEAWSADILPSETPVKREHCSSAFLAGEHGKSPIVDTALGFHYQGDVRDLFNWEHPVNSARSNQQRSASLDRPSLPMWNLFIGHPPCDHLSYAGARWFKAKQADGRQAEAAKFFMEMVNAPSPLVAVENPHSIMQKIYRYPDDIVQPWMFGDPYVKGIHLWLTELPKLNPTHSVLDFPQIFRATTGGGSWRTDKALERKLMSAYEDSEGRANRARVRSRTFPGLAKEMAEQWGTFAAGYYDTRQRAWE